MFIILRFVLFRDGLTMASVFISWASFLLQVWSDYINTEKVKIALSLAGLASFV